MDSYVMRNSITDNIMRNSITDVMRNSIYVLRNIYGSICLKFNRNNICVLRNSIYCMNQLSLTGDDRNSEFLAYFSWVEIIKSRMIIVIIVIIDK